MSLLEKRIKLVEKLINGEAVDKDLVEIEKIETLVKVDPTDILYSDKWEDRISYKQKVMEIETDKDDFLFSLSGRKGETIGSLGRMTLSEIMSFSERIIKEDNGRH